MDMDTDMGIGDTTPNFWEFNDTYEYGYPTFFFLYITFEWMKLILSSCSNISYDDK